MGDTDLRADIAAAKEQMRIKLGSGREIRRLVDHLWEGETVRRMTSGSYGKGQGLIVLTDRRLLFVQDGLMSKTSEDFPLEKVSSVQWASGMLMGTMTIFASGNTAEITNVNKGDGKEMVDLVRQVLSAPKPASPPAPPAAPPAPPAAANPADPMEQLRKLGELRDAGVVTPEEFEEKKAALLERL